MQDAHAVIWVALCSICAMFLWAIWYRGSRAEADAAAKARYDERKAERERDHAQLMQRLDAIDRTIGVQNAALASVMRSDLIHKAQKYIFELHWATPEEVSSWHQEYLEYHSLGADGFIDGIAKQVMSLPTVPPDNEKIGGSK